MENKTTQEEQDFVEVCREMFGTHEPNALAYREGMAAFFFTSKTLEDNPYTDERKEDWRVGYIEASWK